MESSTICLNMIVKNESIVIVRMLESVVKLIDCYCICDTGSSDDTKELIRQFFLWHDIPGKIIDHDFINFEESRNFALESCMEMANYILLMDADMVLSIPNVVNTKKQLKNNFQNGISGLRILQGNEDFFYPNVRIIRSCPEYKYVGVTHEYLSMKDEDEIENISKDDLFIYDIGDGGSKEDKFERDIRLLKEGIKKDPQNKRYWFYLGNSYFDLKKYADAINAYRKRIDLGGWVQELWYCFYRMGLAFYELEEKEIAIAAWLSGYDRYPNRIENLYQLVKHYRMTGETKTAYMFYKMAREIIDNGVHKEEMLFVSNDVYRYKLDYEYTIIGAYNDVRVMSDSFVTILNECNDETIIKSSFSNMKFYDHLIDHNIIMDYTEKIEKSITIHDKTSLRTLYSSSPCIIKHPCDNDKYMMNVRYVNYKIDAMGGYNDCDDVIITQNKLVVLNEGFEVIEEKWFEPGDKHCMYMGIEDIRLFDTKDDKVLFIGTECRDDGFLGISSGQYNRSDKLESLYLTIENIKNHCEKNWVMANVKELEGIGIIYKWYPVALFSLVESNPVLRFVRQIEKMPGIFKYARGSTNGYLYKNELWFIVHMVSYENPRHYYNMVAVFDDKMTYLKWYSCPFKFSLAPIEYCLGLIVENDKIIVSYSTNDSASMISIVELKNMEINNYSHCL